MDAFVYFIFGAQTGFVTFELLINSCEMKVYVIISMAHIYIYEFIR